MNIITAKGEVMIPIIPNFDPFFATPIIDRITPTIPPPITIP
jgi:hypothetical protein